MEKVEGANADVAEFGCNSFEVGVVFRPIFYGDGGFESLLNPEVRHGVVEEVICEQHVAVADDCVRIQATQVAKCFTTKGPCKAWVVEVEIVFGCFEAVCDAVCVGVFPVFDAFIAWGEPAGLVEGLYDVVFLEGEGDLIYPVRSIKHDVTVKRNEFGVLFRDVGF